MTSVSAVVFDIGNVLIEWQPERFYDRVMPVAERKRMFATVDLHAMNDAVDSGGPFKQTIYATAEKYPEYADMIRLWHDRWIELAQPAIQISVNLLRALQKNGVPVFALSNFGIDSFAYAKTQYGFLDDFDQNFISGHLGVIKPNPKIYEILERDSGHSPEGLLFADDRLENIEAAERRGWQGHLFTSGAGLARVLVATGLLTEEQAIEAEIRG